MSTSRSPNFGVIIDSSTRRFACDQCHFQKLRCTRPDDSNSCARCYRLKRPCVWSSPLRSGRPPKIPRLAADTATDTTDATDASDAPDGTTRTADIPRVVFAEDATVDPPSAATTTVGAAADSAPALTPAETPSYILDWSFSEFFGIPSPRSLPGDTQSHAFAFPVHHPGGISVEQPPTPFAPESITENHSHDATHKLSELNTALLRLNNSLHGEPWASMFESPSTLAALLASCDQQATKIVYEYPLVEIFEKTQAFTNLAKLTTATPASAATGVQPSSTATDSFRGSPNSWTSSSCNAAILRNPLTQSFPKRPAKISKTSANLSSALVLATCYAHILDIFLTVFTQMLYFKEALDAIAASTGIDYRAKINPVIPPLQFGGFQPTHNGALQTLVIVQIAIFLLDEIERTLGIDEWERYVTTPREINPDHSSQSRPAKRWCGFDSDDFPSQDLPPQTNPILERTGLTWEMIEMVVREDDDSKPGGRLGKIGTLRKMVKNIKQTTRQC
ncbi:hypothetical protein CRV24_005142 [Beauveria bassiana]|nr:hypothetical protein CRV24_005142 [Beauveria bassiana]KAH8709933.1 C6 finger transcription factor imqK [Beauveria bassiana]